MASSINSTYSFKTSAMEEKKVMTHFTKGLIIGLAMLAIGIVFQVFGIYEQWVQWMVLALYLAAIIWACVSYSNDLEGNVTFGQVFGHGFKTASIVALIGIAGFVLIYFLMPEVKQKALQLAREGMEKNPQLTPENIDQALAFTEKYYFLFGIIGSLFSYALTGLVAALIGGAVAPKNPNAGMPQSL